MHRMSAPEVAHAAAETATHVHAAAKASHMATAAKASHVATTATAASGLGRARKQG